MALAGASGPPWQRIPLRRVNAAAAAKADPAGELLQRIFTAACGASCAAAARATSELGSVVGGRRITLDSLKAASASRALALHAASADSDDVRSADSAGIGYPKPPSSLPLPQCAQAIPGLTATAMHPSWAAASRSTSFAV